MCGHWTTDVVIELFCSYWTNEKATIISDILAKIVNLSVTPGSDPSKLKKAKVIPVFKTEDETDANNYRPISLLSTFERVFEKVMYNWMMHFINVKNILFSAQYGFREGFYTENAIDCRYS